MKDEVEIVVQINGKVKGKMNISTSLDDDAVKEIVLSDDKIKEFTDGKQIVKFIVVKGKLVNIVVK